MKSMFKKLDFLLRETTLWSEEATEEGLGAGTANGREEIGPVVRSEGADFDLTPIAQCLYR